MKWQQVAIILLVILATTGVVTYTDLFGSLFNLTGVEYTHSGDINCDSTCESYINVTTSYWRVCFAHYDDTKYEDEVLFKKVSRSRTLHVNLDKVDNIISTAPNVPVDWLVPTYGNNWRDIKSGDCWERGKTNEIKLVGYKDVREDVKWSFQTGEYIDIDPYWYGQPVGYEYLNGSTVMHIWNTDEDFYFNESSGIQLTNHYNEYWTHNTFCGGRWTGSEWLDLCLDEIPFVWSIESDNLTFVNYTGYYNYFYAGKNLRYTLTYYLERDDNVLTIIAKVENTGKKDIPEDLRLVWRIDDIRINMNYTDNVYYVDEEVILANETIDYITSNLSITAWTAKHVLSNEYLELTWNDEDNYILVIKNESGQLNAPVTLYINISGLNPYTFHETSATWIDAEAIVGTFLLDSTDEHNMAPAGVFIDALTGYAIYGESNTGKDGLVYKKTINGGITWSSSVLLSSSGQDHFGDALWYDQWTPGDDTGELIHICSLEPNTDYLVYCKINTTDDSHSCTNVIDQGALVATDGGCAITKGTDGMLWIGGQNSGAQTVHNSSDGVTWTLQTPSGGGFNDDDDYFQLLPLSGGDILYIYADTSIISLRWGNWNATTKTWENEWTSLLSNTGPASAAYANGGATIYKATGDIYLTWHDDYGGATDDYLNYKFTESSRTWSSLTSIADPGISYQCNIMVDDTTGDLYLIYSYAGATSLVYYVNSSDDGTTWDSETQLSVRGDDIRFVKGGMTSASRLYAWWYNDDTNEIFGNTIITPVRTGILNSSISYPVNFTNVSQNGLFNITATVTCIDQGWETSCGTIYANARYNSSSTTPDTLVNNTVGAIPFYLIPSDYAYFNGFTINTSDDGVSILAGIVGNSTNLWIVDSSADLIYKYYTNSSFIGTWNPTATVDSLFGITMNDSHFWLSTDDVADTNVYKFLLDGTPIDSWALHADNVQPRGIHTDNINMWVIDNVDNSVFKYEMDGTYVTRFTLTEQGITIARGLTGDDEKLWVSYSIGGGLDGKVSVYYKDGTFIETWTTTTTTLPIGIALIDNSYFFINDYTTDSIDKYVMEALNPKSTTSDSNTFTWSVNATGTNNTGWYIGVLFNSSYGSSVISDNKTEDRFVCIGSCVGEVVGDPSTNFTIWNGSNWIDSYTNDEYITFRCTPTQTDCEPENQVAGSSQSIYQVCNNGTGSGTSVDMNMNETYTNIALKCDDDYTSAGATTLTTSNQTIHGALATNACVFISCWVDYTTPTSGGYFDVYAHVQS